MDEKLIQFVLTAFVTLIVVINPVAVSPIFVSVTKGMTREEQRSVLNRAILSSILVVLFFLIAGRAFLSYLGVSIFAFTISGGILLFIIAYPMLFGQRKGMQTPKGEKAAAPDEDVAIFPLTIPMLAGPGTISTALMLGAQASGDWMRLISLIVTILVIYLISWPVLMLSGKAITLLGESRVGMINRILGLILAALAVQFILTGITGYFDSLNQR